jgi:hypothetical protein
MRPASTLDRLGQGAVAGDRAQLVGIGAHHVGQRLRIAGVAFAPEVECRSRNAPPALGLTAYPVPGRDQRCNPRPPGHARCPAAHDRVRHRRPHAASAWNRAIPATPSGSRCPISSGTGRLTEEFVGRCRRYAGVFRRYQKPGPPDPVVETLIYADSCHLAVSLPMEEAS